MEKKRNLIILSIVIIFTLSASLYSHGYSLKLSINDYGLGEVLNLALILTSLGILIYYAATRKR